MRGLVAVSLSTMLLVSLTACGDDDPHNVASQGSSDSADIDSDDQAPTESTDETDEHPHVGPLAMRECLSGTWKMDPASEFLAFIDEDEDTEEVSGEILVSFTVEGGFEQEFRDRYTRIVLDDELGNYVETTTSGTLSGTYAIDQDGFAVIDVSESDLTVTSVKAFLALDDLEESVDEAHDQLIPMVYACGDGQVLGYPLLDEDRNEVWEIYHPHTE